jgi:hypothetical protein
MMEEIAAIVAAYGNRTMNEIRYLIWSEEHQAWWRANATGYTRSIYQAGRFTQAQAHDIVKSANAFLDPSMDPPLNEIAIPDPLNTP